MRYVGHRRSPHSDYPLELTGLPTGTLQIGEKYPFQTELDVASLRDVVDPSYRSEFYAELYTKYCGQLHDFRKKKAVESTTKSIAALTRNRQTEKAIDIKRENNIGDSNNASVPTSASPRAFPESAIVLAANSQATPTTGHFGFAPASISISARNTPVSTTSNLFSTAPVLTSTPTKRPAENPLGANISTRDGDDVPPQKRSKTLFEDSPDSSK